MQRRFLALMLLLCTYTMPLSAQEKRSLRVIQTPYEWQPKKMIATGKQMPPPLIREQQVVTGEQLNGCSALQQDYNHTVISWARTVVASKVFEELLHKRMLSIYQKCKGDPFFNSDIETQFQKVLSACRAPEGVDVNCSGGFGNASAGIGSYDLNQVPEFSWSGWMSSVVDQLNFPLCTGGQQPPGCRFGTFPWPYDQGAGIVWHELMHQYGYTHGGENNADARTGCAIDPSNTTWNFQVNTVPYLVQQVIEDIIDTSYKRLGGVNNCPSTSELRLLDTWDGNTGSCQVDPSVKVLGILSADGSTLHDVAIVPQGNWIDDWHSSPTDKILGSGDFNGDGIRDFIVQSSWGIGIISYNKPHWGTLFMAPAGSIFGDWHYAQSDEVALIGDFNGDGRDEVLLKSNWGVGILGMSRDGQFKSILMTPYNGWMDQWHLGKTDKFLKVGDFDGNGYTDMLIRSDWGIGYVGMNLTGNGYWSYVVKPNNSWFGSWHLANQDEIIGVGRYTGTTWDEVAVKSTWGIGIIRLTGPNSLNAVAAVPFGQMLGSWNLKNTDQIPLTGDFNGDGKADLLITSSWGIGVLNFDGKNISSYLVKQNGTRFGTWNLNTAKDNFVLKGNFIHNAKTDILVKSDWGLGILSTVGAGNNINFISNSAKPFQSSFGSWLFENIDRISGAGHYAIDSKLDEILIQK